MTIRPYERKDRKAVLSFIVALQEFERELGVDRKPGKAMSEFYLSYLQKEVKKKRGVILVAEHEGSPVGFGAVWIEHDDAADAIMRSKTTHAYIADVYVDENVRQKGTGTKLLNALDREAKKRGAREIRMHMLANNVVMRLVAGKAGYTEEEIEVVKSLG